MAMVETLQLSPVIDRQVIIPVFAPVCVMGIVPFVDLRFIYQVFYAVHFFLTCCSHVCERFIHMFLVSFARQCHNPVFFRRYHTLGCPLGNDFGCHGNTCRWVR